MVTLRTFHLVFIVFAIIVADMLGAWAIHQAPITGNGWYLGGGILTLVLGLGLAAYSIFFVRRMDEADIH